MTPMNFVAVDPRAITSCGKLRYADKKAALTSRNRILSGHRRHQPKDLRAYFCPACRGWHLTKA